MRIVERDDGTYVLTHTQWNRDAPRLAVATSRDLVTWTKHGPAFAKAADGKYLKVESKSGAILSRVEGNRIVATRINGKYWMYYNVPDILIATSDNLIDWTSIEDANGSPLKVLSPRPGYFDSRLVEAGPPAIIRTVVPVLRHGGFACRRRGMGSTAQAGHALGAGAWPSRRAPRGSRPSPGAVCAATSGDHRAF